MSRRKKVIISEEELVPTTLAIIKDKKKASIFGLVWIIIIFVIFVYAALHLPEIAVYVNNYLNQSEKEIISKEYNQIKEEDNTDVTQIEEYPYSSDLVITLEKFTISNFSIQDKTIKFKITNLTSEILELKELHYFMQLYNSSKTLLQRIYLQDIISPSSSLDVSYELNSEEIDRLTLYVINEEDYPAHVVEVPKDGAAKLVCTKDNETLEYTVNNNKVIVTNILYQVDIKNPNFTTYLSNYQLLKSTYETIEGVSSNLTTNDNVLKFNTIIKLDVLKENTLNLKTVYPYGTDAKVIYFELSSSGYKCN